MLPHLNWRGALYLGLPFLLAVLLLTTAGPVRGQAISGDLVGTVVDPSGSGIPNATVEATNVATNVKSTTTTNANGEYRLTNLPPGTYSIMARAGGFATTQLQNVRVNLNQTATANIKPGNSLDNDHRRRH